jgi:ABC-2 type transport system permease protein
VFAIIIKELKLIRKDKRSFLFLLLMPALFIVMFSSFYGGSGSGAVTLHAVDQDQSAASRELIGRMDRAMEVKLDDPSSLEEQLGKIRKGQYSALLVIPAGFESGLKQGKASSLQLYEDPSAQAALAPVQAILDSISNQYRDQKLAAAFAAMGAAGTRADQIMASPIHIESIPTSSDHLGYVDQVVPGMTVMFVFFIIITMTRRFFEEKKTGLLSRIRSTGIKPLHYLIGMWIPFVLTVIAQCVVLFAFGRYVYGLKLGDIAALAVIVVALSVAGTGIGLGLSFLVPGESAAMVITQVISMGGAMAGGLWMPSYLLPKFLQTIGLFTPQFWAQHSLQNVFAHGAHTGDILGAAAILLIFGAAGLLVAFLRLPGFLRSAAS